MVVIGDQLITLKVGSDKNNNHLLVNVANILIVVGTAAVLVTLSSTERPFHHEHVNLNVLRQGFKDYGHDQKVLVSILSYE